MCKKGGTTDIFPTEVGCWSCIANSTIAYLTQLGLSRVKNNNKQTNKQTKKKQEIYQETRKSARNCIYMVSSAPERWPKTN